MCTCSCFICVPNVYDDSIACCHMYIRKTFLEMLSIIYLVAAIDFLLPSICNTNFFSSNPITIPFISVCSSGNSYKANFMNKWTHNILPQVVYFFEIRNITFFKHYTYTLFYTYFYYSFWTDHSHRGRYTVYNALINLANCCCTLALAFLTSVMCTIWPSANYNYVKY